MNNSQPRGFSVVALERPKHDENVGGVIRAAGNYGAKAVIIESSRCQRFASQASNTMKYHRHNPVIPSDDLFKNIPCSAIPVVVELCDDAVALPEFEHPAQAVYIFGPEDGSVKAKTIDRCPFKIYVPTVFCMNLAATVNVVLYDRALKLGFPEHLRGKREDTINTNQKEE